jgi:magnesium transporter
MDQPRIRRMEYSGPLLQDAFIEDAASLVPPRPNDPCCWININGLHDMKVMTSMATAFHLPGLVLEDVVNTGQRPKLETFPESVFVTLKMLSLGRDRTTIDSEQISAILQKNTLLTFQEKPGDLFDPVRTRLQNPKGRLRHADLLQEKNWL